MFVNITSSFFVFYIDIYNITFTISMTSKAKYSLINTSISNSVEIKTRKFYKIQQIFAVFCNEMALVNNITISKLTFQKNMNIIAERTTTLLERVHPE